MAWYKAGTGETRHPAHRDLVSTSIHLLSLFPHCNCPPPTSALYVSPPLNPPRLGSWTPLPRCHHHPLAFLPSCFRSVTHIVTCLHPKPLSRSAPATDMPPPPAFSLLWGGGQRIWTPGNRVHSNLCSRWVQGACKSPATSLRPWSMWSGELLWQSMIPELQDQDEDIQSTHKSQLPELGNQEWAQDSGLADQNSLQFKGQHVT